MGLSSLQARLLMLTSRLADIEFAQVMLSQRQTTLAMDSEDAAMEHNKALNNMKLQVRIKDSDEDGGFRTEDMTYKNMASMGYLLTNAKKQIYLQKDENGEWIIPKNLEEEPLLTIDANGKATVKGDPETQYEIVDGGSYLSDKQIFQDAIMNGMLLVFDTTDNQVGLELSMLDSETEIRYVLDTSDDAQAESKYQCEMARVSRQENLLDMEMKQLETEHQVILKEYESIKEVIGNNVDRTYNLFSDG